VLILPPGTRWPMDFSASCGALKMGTWYDNGTAFSHFLHTYLVFVVETIEADHSQLISMSVLSVVYFLFFIQGNAKESRQIEVFRLLGAVFVCVVIAPASALPRTQY
jgi:hypothetical protein